jgi:hypothetical protein
MSQWKRLLKNLPYEPVEKPKKLVQWGSIEDYWKTCLLRQWKR